MAHCEWGRNDLEPNWLHRPATFDDAFLEWLSSEPTLSALKWRELTKQIIDSYLTTVNLLQRGRVENIRSISKFIARNVRTISAIELEIKLTAACKSRRDTLVKTGRPFPTPLTTDYESEDNEDQDDATDHESEEDHDGSVEVSSNESGSDQSGSDQSRSDQSISDESCFDQGDLRNEREASKVDSTVATQNDAEEREEASRRLMILEQREEEMGKREQELKRWKEELELKATEAEASNAQMNQKAVEIGKKIAELEERTSVVINAGKEVEEKIAKLETMKDNLDTIAARLQRHETRTTVKLIQAKSNALKMASDLRCALKKATDEKNERMRTESKLKDLTQSLEVAKSTYMRARTRAEGAESREMRIQSELLDTKNKLAWCEKSLTNFKRHAAKTKAREVAANLRARKANLHLLTVSTEARQGDSTVEQIVDEAPSKMIEEKVPSSPITPLTPNRSIFIGAGVELSRECVIQNSLSLIDREDRLSLI